MRKLWAVLGLSLAAAPAAAVNVDNYRIPYASLMGDYVITDSGREGDAGYGFQLNFGIPMGEDGVNAWEVTFFDHAYKRDVDDKKNYQTGVLLDFVHDFGAFGWKDEDSWLASVPGFQPFVLAGLGFVQEDVFGEKHQHMAVEAGGGVLMPFGNSGLALRLDARAAYQSNKDSVPDQSSVIDVRFMAGLQIPLTWFFDRDVPVPAQEECEISVVDPKTGRTDCAADSDRDGVADTADQCPATPAGAKVDAKGCPKVEGPADSDADGVLDQKDKCPGTREGIKVDDTGCAVTQTFSVYDVTFTPDSAELTEDGKRTLDGMAETLAQQTNLKAEIAGHTDSIGSEAYNLLLSQQRAEAVRAYLIEKGIAEQRLTAGGYGESQPLASNDTDEGRAQNRRVEFRIEAQ